MGIMKRFTALVFVATMMISCGGGGGGSSSGDGTGLPSAPTGVSATAGNGSVALNWAAVSGAASYNIYWSAAEGVTVSTGTRISGAASPYTHTGLANGTTYYYIVTAVSADGESTPSAQVSAKPSAAAPPEAPAGVSATAGNRRATIGWTAVAGATSYNIYWSTTTGVTAASGTKITAATNPYTHTGLTNGTTYYYVVTALNDNGESAASAQASCKPMGPAAPSGVTVTPGNGQATIAWNAVSGALYYNIYWSTTSGVTIAGGTKITHANSPYTLSGLTNGTDYYFIVTAVYASGESGASSQTGAKPAYAPPPSGTPISFILPPMLGPLERCSPFSYQILGLQGGAGYPYTFNLGTGGTPPLGIFVNAGGLIEGETPSPEGVYNFDVCVTDAVFTQKCQPTSITVISPVSPGIPADPFPSDGATGVSTSPTLTWTASANAQSYSVYFGTSNPPSKVTDVNLPTYTPSYALSPNTTYYWQIIATHEMCNLLPPTVSGGPVWSFRTGTTSGGLSISIASQGCAQTWGNCDPNAFCSCMAQYTMSYSGSVCGPVGSYVNIGVGVNCGSWHASGSSCERQASDPACTNWSYSVLNNSGLAPGSTYSGELTVYDLQSNSASATYSFTCPHCTCPSPCTLLHRGGLTKQRQQTEADSYRCLTVAVMKYHPYCSK